MACEGLRKEMGSHLLSTAMFEADERVLSSILDKELLNVHMLSQFAVLEIVDLSKTACVMRK
jgi:hypothetical protein